MRECETERTNREATLTLTGPRMVPGEQVRQKQRNLRNACVRGGLALLASTALCLPSARLLAQPAAEPEAKPVVGAPAAPQPEVAATAPSAQPAVAAPAPVEAPPPPPPPASNMPTLKIGMGVRTGLSIGSLNPKGAGDGDVNVKLSDGLFDLVTIRPYFSSQLTKHIGVVANFDIETGSGFNLLDAIAQFKVVDEFQIWVGQHIPANDRNNFCGPFFANTWQFAVDIQAYPMDFAARDRGLTFWGLVAGGIIKYQASVVDLQPGRKIETARYAGRVTLNLLDPENYYYASGSYFGSQDVLALGAVFSYQKGLDTTETSGMDAAGLPITKDLKDNDFIGFSFDALFEKRLGKAGTLTLEAGYWNFDNTGADYRVNQNSKSVGTGFVSGYGQSVLGAVSWLTPGKIGIGHIQPNVKFQWADKKTSGGEGSKYDTKIVDLGLGYIIDGYNHQWRANYRFGNTPLGVENTFQLGIQFQI